MNPTKLKAFKEAYKIRLRNSLQENEMLAYLIGTYTTKAIACTFGKSKYPEKPIGLFSDNDDDSKDIEVHEKKAAMEMEFYASVLKKQGLKESVYKNN